MPYVRRRGMYWGRMRPGLRKFAHAARWSVRRLVRRVNAVRKLVNVEYKVADVNNSSVTVGNSGQTYNLSDIAQGTDATQRIGRQIRNKSLQYKFWFRIHPSAANTKVRCILIKDTQPELGVLSLSEILSGSDIDAFKTFNSKNRIIFLRDMHINLDQEAAPLAVRRGYLRLNDHTVWDSSGNLTKGKYILFVLSSEATNQPILDFHSRLRFIDN